MASRRRIGVPALFRLLRSLAGRSSFFARSTRLLAREIARIASRQCPPIPAAHREEERSTGLPLPLANIISLPLYLLALYSSSDLVATPAASRFLGAVTPRRRRYVQSRFLEYTCDQEARSPRDLRRTRTGSRFSALRRGCPSVTRDEPEREYARAPTATPPRDFGRWRF